MKCPTCDAAQLFPGDMIDALWIGAFTLGLLYASSDPAGRTRFVRCFCEEHRALFEGACKRLEGVLP